MIFFFLFLIYFHEIYFLLFARCQQNENPLNLDAWIKHGLRYHKEILKGKKTTDNTRKKSEILPVKVEQTTKNKERKNGKKKCKEGENKKVGQTCKDAKSNKVILKEIREWQE